MNSSAVDAVIESALAEEHARKAPAGFFGRMRRRLALASLIQQEQRLFRKYATAAGGFLLTVGCVVALAYLASIPSRIAWYVPGGMGFVDYVKTQLSMSMRLFAAFIALGLAIPLCAALFAYFRPSGKSDGKRRDTLFW
jgi:hypothetical protein